MTVSALPIGPGFEVMDVTSNDPTLVDTTQGGNSAFRKVQGQKWNFTLQWPQMLQSEYKPIYAALCALRGQYNFCQFTPPVFGASTGSLAMGINLLTWSEHFDNAAWFKGNITVSALVATGPNGYCTACSLSDGTATGIHNVAMGGIAINAGEVYTFSCYLFQGSGSRYASLFLDNGDADGCTATFDLQEGVVSGSVISNSGGAATPISAAITNDGSGWLRCSVTGIVGPTDATARVSVLMTNSNIAQWYPSYSGSNALMYAFGAQLEQASSPSPYVMTMANAAVGTIAVRDSSNLLLYSQDFTNVSWVKTDTTVTGNTTVAPDGTTTGCTIARTATGNNFILQQVTDAAPAGKTYTFSVWLLAGTGTIGQVRVWLKDGAANNVGESQFILTSTWQRYVFTGTFPAGSAADVQCILDPTNDTGSPGDSFIAWGAQLELSPVPTAYQVTTTNQVTNVPQNGLTLQTSGWSPGAQGVMKAGDFVTSASHTKVYSLSADLSADAYGVAVMQLAQPLVKTPTSGETVTTNNVPFQVRMATDTPKVELNKTLYSITQDFIEDWQ